MSTATATPPVFSSTGPIPESRVAFDWETHRVGPGNVVPRPVCYSLAWRDDPADLNRTPRAVLVANGDGNFEAAVEAMLDSALQDGTKIVGHTVAAFDMPVISIHLPRLRSKAWKVMERGLVRDCLYREQLLNLALHGYVDTYFLPDKTKKDVNYRLETLAMKYLGLDLSGTKAEKGKRGEDTDSRQGVWQLHFDQLDGMASRDYPSDASDYVMRDAVAPLRVCEMQDWIAWQKFGSHGAVAQDGVTPFDVFQTEWLHAGAAFALAHMTVVGFGIDQTEVAKMKAAVQRALRPEQMEILYKSGLLRRAEAPRPFANGACGSDGLPLMTKGKESSRDKAAILARVLKVHAENARCDEKTCPLFGLFCEEHGLPPLERTAPSKKFPVSEENPFGGQISCDADCIALLAPHDVEVIDGVEHRVLAAYERWQGLGKLLDLEIPVLEGNSVIHGAYEVLKKTQRTSCRGSKNYPSRNLQQVPRGFEVDVYDDKGNLLYEPVFDKDKKPVFDANGLPKMKAKKERVEPRRCYIAPYAGWVLISVDYSFLELVTLAQMAYKEIGYSRLRDVINSGADPHAWLGAQLAHGSDPWFAARCIREGLVERDAYYKLFAKFKRGSDEEQSLYMKYRGLAKPTGLGLGGGMGAKRLMDYALSTFGIQIENLETAKSYKEIWLDAFPEMREYLNRYIRDRLRDEMHEPETKEDGKKREYFAYYSPLGVYRSRCYYTEAANGFGLQTRAGEGAKLAVFNVTRACWDEAIQSILYGIRPLAFVHDELIVAAPNDHMLHARAFEVSRLMVEAMNIVCPDMLVQAEPAVMLAWEKGAELVLGPDDKIRPWLPGVKYKADANGKLRAAA